MPCLRPQLAGGAPLVGAMTDWQEAGRKADAHRVRDLYRAAFGSKSKDIARDRVIQAMRTAGVTTVLDLWGGGLSATAFVAAGFQVISVDNGSMKLVDRNKTVTKMRKRRALEYAAAEDGYEARVGNVQAFASEADGAYLDFCGPWSAGARRAVQACRHMKCVAVTLMPDHDLSTDASSRHEREMAYQLFLKMAWADKPRWQAMQTGGGVRRLLDYRRERGYSVFLYLLSHKWLRLPVVARADREKTRPDMHERHLQIKRNWYHRQTIEKKRANKVRDLERHNRQYRDDPVFRARILLHVNHRKHLLGAVPKKPCALCVPV